MNFKEFEDGLQVEISKIFLKMDFILYKMGPVESLPPIYEWAAKGGSVRHLYFPMFLRNPKSSHP